MGKRVLTGVLGVLVVTTLGLAMSGPAHAENPKPEKREVSLQVIDRPDSGTGSPTYWAHDTFKRNVTVLGGPNYQFPELASVDATASEKEAQATVAEKLRLKVNICTIVKQFGLVWKYEATVEDDGTFVTLNDSPTGSPGEGKSLVKDAEGTFVGGATAKFYAPAHWCSFRGEKYNGKTVPGTETGSTGEFIGKLFKKDGYPAIKPKHKDLLVKWGWTYTRCAETTNAERWVNAKSGNEGDIRGVVCPTPEATPSPTPSVGVTSISPSPAGGVAGGDGDQLPKTGAGVAALVAGGGVLVLIGAGVLVLQRRRRVQFTA